MLTQFFTEPRVYFYALDSLDLFSQRGCPCWDGGSWAGVTPDFFKGE